MPGHHVGETSYSRSQEPTFAAAVATGKALAALHTVAAVSQAAGLRYPDRRKPMHGIASRDILAKISLSQNPQRIGAPPANRPH
jgi:hypothetical protein